MSEATDIFFHFLNIFLCETKPDEGKMQQIIQQSPWITTKKSIIMQICSYSIPLLLLWLVFKILKLSVDWRHVLAKSVAWQMLLSRMSTTYTRRKYSSKSDKQTNQQMI